MILAVVDDLMFASKISSAAQRLGIDVVFAKSADEVLTHARALRPHLVIFDLKGPPQNKVNIWPRRFSSETKSEDDGVAAARRRGRAMKSQPKIARPQMVTLFLAGL